MSAVTIARYLFMALLLLRPPEHASAEIAVDYSATVRHTRRQFDGRSETEPDHARRGLDVTEIIENAPLHTVQLRVFGLCACAWSWTGSTSRRWDTSHPPSFRSGGSHRRTSESRPVLQRLR